MRCVVRGGGDGYSLLLFRCWQKVVGMGYCVQGKGCWVSRCLGWAVAWDAENVECGMWGMGCEVYWVLGFEF